MPDTTGQNPDSGKYSSTVQDLQDIFRKLKTPKSKLEPEWYLNVAYFNGDQWVFWNNGKIDRPNLESWRVTLVDNRILPAATTRISRKVKNRPTFISTPNSYDEGDLNASEIGGKVLDDDWINLNLQKKLFDVLMWAEVCTAGFWKIYWDKTRGDYSTSYVMDPQGQPYEYNGRPLRGDTPEAEAVLGIEGFSTADINVGDVCVDVVSPFNFYPDPLAETVHDCEVIVEEHVRSVEYVKKYYNKEISPDTQVPVGISESRMFPFMTTETTGGDYDGITVYELYAKPSSKYGSAGKRCVWAGDEILKEETLETSPYIGCPYVMFPGIEVPGRFWPTSITTQLRSPQTELNKMQSQIRENAIRFGNPALLTSTEANVKYTGVPGERIYYSSVTSDAVPSYLNPPEMPVYVREEIERIENSITEISGLHEVSKANVPAGVTAASAINLLQEADETRIGPEIQAMEKALGEAGEKILKLRAKYQTDQRLIRSAGEDGDWDIASFRNTMLKDNTNVEVQAGSAMPKSQAAKQAAMTELLQTLLQYGQEFRPQDLRKFLREYGVGGLESMFAGLSDDEQQIKREHNLMKNGTAIDINDFDDDDLHIEGHESLQKSKWYWNANDQLKMIIDTHVNAHKERRQAAIDAQVAEQQKQMQNAIAMQNGSGTTPTSQVQ